MQGCQKGLVKGFFCNPDERISAHLLPENGSEQRNHQDWYGQPYNSSYSPLTPKSKDNQYLDLAITIFLQSASGKTWMQTSRRKNTTAGRKILGQTNPSHRGRQGGSVSATALSYPWIVLRGYYALRGKRYTWGGAGSKFSPHIPKRNAAPL